MAIYENTREEAEAVIRNNWQSNHSKPSLFAYVEIRFGEKYMIDYSETSIRPGIRVIEDLICEVEDICV